MKINNFTNSFCTNDTKKVYHLTCNECKCIFTAPHNSYKICPNCLSIKNTYKCDLCNKKFIDVNKIFGKEYKSLYICNDCIKSLPGNGKILLRCNNKNNHINDKFKGFYLSQSPNAKNMCTICFSKTVKCKNPNCDNIIHNIYIQDNLNHFCSQKCQRIYNSIIRVNKNIKPGYCIECGKYQEHRDALGFGVECGCCKRNSQKATKASIPITKKL